MKQLTDNSGEDTQSSDLTSSQKYRKQRVNSPLLWVQLVGGSLVLHGALLAIALPLTARLSAASQSETSTPVEFVELSEPSSEPAVKIQPAIESAAPTALLEPAPAEPAPIQPTFNETISPNDISLAPEPSPKISPSPIPSPEVLPFPESSPEPSPATSPSPEVRAENSSDTAALPPQPDSLPLPVLPSVSPATPFPQPNPPVFPPSDPGLQTTRIDTPVPDVSGSIAAAPSTVDSDNLNSANSEAAAPVGVTLSLSSSSRVAPTADESIETLEVARPTTNSTSFLPDPSASACQVTPDVLNRIGTPIALQVTTDEQGKVTDVSIYQPSGSLDYDQLAVCLVKEQWSFEPATVLNTGETQRQAIASNELLITLVIDIDRN